MQVHQAIDDCRAAVIHAKQSGRSVGLVPTMGALHEGHRSLIRAARDRCDFVAVTIFVNPTQFGPGEDFEHYPNRLDADIAVCEVEGVDLVFAPSVNAMYSEHVSTTVHVAHLTDGLCGQRRPGHFDGVTTVVNKLFNIVPADAAFFGEKDYQQLQVIRRMVADLNRAIEIVGCPTVRNPDGLALSSRNQYLSTAQRHQACSIHRALQAAAKRVADGERDAGEIISRIGADLVDAGECDIEYVEAVDADSLAPLVKLDRPARLCVAVRIGACRLIDNIGVDPP